MRELRLLRYFLLAAIWGLTPAIAVAAPVKTPLEPMDLFELEYASDPQVSPDGERVIFLRHSMDIMHDRQQSRLWIARTDGSDLRPLETGVANVRGPRWSPQGDRLAYIANGDGSSQIHLKWMDSGETTTLTQLRRAPQGLSWSPDGQWIAFSMLVPERSEPMVKTPGKPEGAEWAESPKVIEKLRYRSDGAGYLEDGYRQIFVLSALGGTPRQVTSGPFNHGGTLTWSDDGASILFSANRHEDWEYDPLDSEVFELRLADGHLEALTDRRGPDSEPVLSPDGTKIAYLGYDDHLRGYEVTHLYVMARDGSGSRLLTAAFDRDIESPVWDADNSGLYFQYDDHGNTKIAHLLLDGEVQDLISDVGGTSLGRPYSGGSFTIVDDASKTASIAFTQSRPEYPADIAVWRTESGVRRLTHLNDDLFSFRAVAAAEEIWAESSYDKRQIQAWVIKPPAFESGKKYPLILEIHGGPFSNYGDRFTAEIQLYAAAGYVVVYANPRGSTSYGGEFGNLIHHNYPGRDYDDLMSVVDEVVGRGYVDPERLYVTGGSGGGVLSSWIVGKTDRFRAAVVAKPVINWYSFVLTSDGYPVYYKYWFPGFPWDHADHYLARSPLSLVGNVTTPTMLLTGEVDYRTPISESEQYYQALKLRRVPAALVRIPEASHGIVSRPSYLMAKVEHILAWFERYGGPAR